MTAYEMRISDWSSDVCSSDLNASLAGGLSLFGRRFQALERAFGRNAAPPLWEQGLPAMKAMRSPRNRGDCIASKLCSHEAVATRTVPGPVSTQRLATRSFGNLKVQSIPPWLKSFTRLATSPPHNGTAPPQPESTETYCSPSISQVMGEPSTPEIGRAHV